MYKEEHQMEALLAYQKADWRRAGSLIDNVIVCRARLGRLFIYE